LHSGASGAKSLCNMKDAYSLILAAIDDGTYRPGDKDGNDKRH